MALAGEGSRSRSARGGTCRSCWWCLRRGTDLRLPSPSEGAKHLIPAPASARQRDPRRRRRSRSARQRYGRGVEQLDRCPNHRAGARYAPCTGIRLERMVRSMALSGIRRDRVGRLLRCSQPDGSHLPADVTLGRSGRRQYPARCPQTAPWCPPFTPRKPLRSIDCRRQALNTVRRCLRS